MPEQDRRGGSFPSSVFVSSLFTSSVFDIELFLLFPQTKRGELGRYSVREDCLPLPFTRAGHRTLFALRLLEDCRSCSPSCSSGSLNQDATAGAKRGPVESSGKARQH